MFSPTTKAICFRLLAVGMFTPIFAAGKLADGAFPALAIMTMRYFGGFLTVCGYIFISRTSPVSLVAAKPSRHLIRACLGTGGGVFAIHAGSVMPVANAAAIGLTQGIMIIALAGLVLKEPITRLHWLAGAIAMSGAGLVVTQSIDFTTIGLGSWEGSAAAFTGALFIAFEALMIKFVSSRERGVSTLLYVNGFGSMIVLALALVWLDWGVFANPVLWVFLIIGPVAISAQFFNIQANLRANAATLAPITYSWVLFAALMGLFLFDEIPTVITIIGSLLIVAGGIVVSKVR